ncbi:MAG: hypothetical protein OSJ46_04515 [Duncaniella sp.]|nr:hypothetical protein [Duncaniella sp.]
MATKNQLKQYFKTGSIPTQAQFGKLIDFVQPLISDNVSDRPNQTLLFGGDGTKPIVNGLRIVHYYENNDTIYNYWIFTNEAGENNQSGISIPMFVIKRISSKEPNLSLGMPDLEYAIPTREQLTDWVRRGYNCDTADAGTLHLALTDFTFKPWSEGGGSEFPRIAYIDSQSDWNTWLTKFKAAHPEADNSDESDPTRSNNWVINSYTFIIECSNNIDFATDSDSYEFFNCNITTNGFVSRTITLDFTNCAFENCHLNSGFSITGGIFNNCSLVSGVNISNANISDCNLDGSGSIHLCDIGNSDVKSMELGTGSVRNSNIQGCNIEGAEIDGCRLHSCTIRSAKLTSKFIEMIGCNIPHNASFKNAFNNSATEIKGFICGCDFSTLESIPGAMKGVQGCLFKSTFTGVIKTDIFG